VGEGLFGLGKEAISERNKKYRMIIVNGVDSLLETPGGTKEIDGRGEAQGGPVNKRGKNRSGAG